MNYFKYPTIILTNTSCKVYFKNCSTCEIKIDEAIDIKKRLGIRYNERRIK